ncbi:Hsp20/alpha crystallin family protein [Larkinella arboricola]|uniref:HSP20 family protein n=1 Tax=Larkinella arboricola TaxID=643671 RepID=A0A327WVK5_LARAB|nr:Hsp20/alpha crystallin family protein [Larkinella arboricola]RAJ95726.1 HSP20 family protein [Larkinella arboricola]
MSLVKFNGNGNRPSLLDEFMGRDMDELFNFNWPGVTRSRVGATVPAVNIKEDADRYSIELAAPGMRKEDFNLTLDNGKLTVSSQQHYQNEEKDQNGQYTKREFSYHAFSRSFWLPETCDQQQIEARYTDGILHIVLPKKEEAKQKAPTQIQIS